MWVSFDVLCCTLSILHLVAVALDRYWAVTRIDYMSNRSAKTMLTMIGISWAISICISTPPLFGWKDGDNNRTNPDLTGECIISQNWGYTIYSTLGAFYLPLAAILIIYFKIFQEARARIRKEQFRIQPKRKSVSRKRSSATQITTVNPTLSAKTLENTTPKPLTTLKENLSNTSLPPKNLENGHPQHQTPPSRVHRDFINPACSAADSPSINAQPGASARHAERETAENKTTPMTQRPIVIGPMVINDAASSAMTQRSINSGPIGTKDVASSATAAMTQRAVNSGPMATKDAASSIVGCGNCKPSVAKPEPLHPKERTRLKLEQRRERKAARTLAIITGVFICCWLPFFLLAVVKPFCGQHCHVPTLFSGIILWLGYLNSMLNPIIYTIFNTDFRMAFRKILFGKYRYYNRAASLKRSMKRKSEAASAAAAMLKK